ncbi:hypothetical protein [Streptomyces sp. NPDC005435]|uniref:AraC-like ligand-binding domain-containing protein n=1 Tax=Streptomyces sp. NPDC005435 TaxID=3154464 RepID=UPI003452F01C
MARRPARFDGFLLDSGVPLRVSGPETGPFRATARALDLGSVTVVSLTCSPCVLRRTAALIRRRDPEVYAVPALPRRGGLTVTRAAGEVPLNGGDFTVCDSSRPFDVRITGAPRTSDVKDAVYSTDPLQVDSPYYHWSGATS